MQKSFIAGFALIATIVAAQQAPNPRQQPGAAITMFAPDQHDLYDGHYVMSASRIYMVGGLLWQSAPHLPLEVASAVGAVGVIVFLLTPGKRSHP